jgi:hypothetical protein
VISGGRWIFVCVALPSFLALPIFPQQGGKSRSASVDSSLVLTGDRGEKATNYRCWCNNAWEFVEAAGQAHAGEWTEEKMSRLRAPVERAHTNGLWISFYTLDGAAKAELSCRGWFHGYNFGSIDTARIRCQCGTRRLSRVGPV